MGISIWLRVSENAKDEFHLDNSLYAGIDVLIAVGSIIMVLGFLGCCGAMKESQCMLLLFFIGLLLILILQIVAGILGAVYKPQIEETLNKTLTDDIRLLQSTTSEFQQFQENFRQFEIKNRCCGLINGEKDWGTNKGKYNGCACADSDKSTDVCKNSIYITPCSQVLIEFVKNNLIIVMGVAFGLALIEVLGLVFSMSLYCQIQRK
ncbi:tetraspanin-8 [Hemicordylus capensis]|uniref:tetraspanin-8 n=1 Tax=Hemicordylus capensis TaxID=884348 RepID=UPI0023020EA2|nr:tetraspanin-8 [Hemicordylus capensis]